MATLTYQNRSKLSQKAWISDHNIKDDISGLNYLLVHHGAVRHLVLPAVFGGVDAARVRDAVSINGEAPPVGRTVHAAALHLRSNMHRGDSTRPPSTYVGGGLRLWHLRPPASCPQSFWNRRFRSCSWKSCRSGCPGRYCWATRETEQRRANVTVTPSGCSDLRTSPCSWRCTRRWLQRSQWWSPTRAGWQTGGGGGTLPI